MAKINLSYNWLLLFAVIIIYIFLSVYRLADFPVFWHDEASYMDMAINISEKGSFSSTLHLGAIGIDERVYFVMPLYPYLLSFDLSLFGDGIIQGRLLSVIFGLISMIMVYLIVRRLFGTMEGISSAFLLSTTHMFIWFSRSIMPYMFAVTFSLIALYIFIILKDKQNKLIFALLIGLSLGFSILSHPIGLGMVLSIATLILIQDKKVFYKKRDNWYIVLFSLIVILPYIVYVYTGWKELLNQMHTYSVHANIMHGYTGAIKKFNILYNILHEIPMRYFSYSGAPKAFLVRTLFLSIGYLASFFYLPALAKRYKNMRFLAIPFLLQILLISIMPNKYNGYLISITPYVSIVIALGLFTMFKNFRIMNFIFFLMFSVFILSNILILYLDLDPKRNEGRKYPIYINNIKENLTQGATIVCNGLQWFGLRKDFDCITDIPLSLKIYDSSLHSTKYSKSSDAKRFKIIDEMFKEEGVDFFLLTDVFDSISEQRAKSGKEPTMLDKDILNYLKRKGKLIAEVKFPGRNWMDTSIYKLEY